MDVDPTFIKGYYHRAKAQHLLWEYDEAKSTITRGLALNQNNSDLRSIQTENKESIDYRESFHKDTLKPTLNLKFLSGGYQCRIPLDSSYGRLKRIYQPRK